MNDLSSAFHPAAEALGAVDPFYTPIPVLPVITEQPRELGWVFARLIDPTPLTPSEWAAINEEEARHGE